MCLYACTCCACVAYVCVCLSMLVCLKQCCSFVFYVCLISVSVILMCLYVFYGCVDALIMSVDADSFVVV